MVLLEIAVSQSGDVLVILSLGGVTFLLLVLVLLRLGSGGRGGQSQPISFSVSQDFSPAQLVYCLSFPQGQSVSNHARKFEEPL